MLRFLQLGNMVRYVVAVLCSNLEYDFEIIVKHFKLHDLYKNEYYFCTNISEMKNAKNCEVLSVIWPVLNILFEKGRLVKKNWKPSEICR